MATKIDKEKVKLATALVSERTARIELQARRVQLLGALVGFASVFVGVLGALAILVPRL
jgi:hypothetical protein